MNTEKKCMVCDKNGVFVISLDFELFWGVRDVYQIKDYEENIKGVHRAIPALLTLFDEYKIHATWATVGFIFFENERQLKLHLPTDLPNYLKKVYCPYEYLKKSPDSINSEYHFAPQLIRQIQNSLGQEIGTHTFSHYYCLEESQTRVEFEADIKAAVTIAHKFDISLKSIIFPRNQCNEEYFTTLTKYNITSYRGTESCWLYRPIQNNKNFGWLKRALRLLDAYINLTGHHCVPINGLKSSPLINLPSSRFLRPFQPALKAFEFLRLRRIKKSMHYAAKNGMLFHLWWHPHNFGRHLDENIAFLRKILLYFNTLKSQYGMSTMSMSEAAVHAMTDTNKK